MSENLKIVLREANILDVDRLVALHKTAWVAAYSDDIDSPALAIQDRESRAHFGEVFSGNSSATVWVAEEPAAKALGFCECEAKGPHEIRSLEVTMLYVNPAFTGRGIGSALLQRAIGDAQPTCGRGRAIPKGSTNSVVLVRTAKRASSRGCPLSEWFVSSTSFRVCERPPRAGSR